MPEAEQNAKKTTSSQEATARIIGRPDESLKKMLEEQKEILLAIYEQVRKTRRYILVGRVISFIYLIMIIAPIILAAIYLPPLLKNAIEPYKELLGTQNEIQTNLNPGTMSDILKQIK